MPCAFWWPAVMTLHAEALLQKVHEFSKGLPYILLGDFNIIPHTPLYNFLTQGLITDPQFLPSPEWHFDNICSLADIRTLSGFPFLPTNCARNPSGSLFEEAIDHIFFSPHFSDHKISYAPPSGEMPNETTGSDHVLVSCQLTLN